MPMGRERNILRWDLHAYLLRKQIEQLDEELATGQGSLATLDDAARARLEAARMDLQRQLDALGPSPSAKMG